MRLNLSKIVAFYKNDIGAYVHEVLSERLGHFTRHLPRDDAMIVASAGTCFYKNVLDQRSDRMAFQLYHTSHADLQSGEGCLVECSREHWPYRAENVDGVVMIHDLEFAEQPDVYLREAWRVLKGEGRLLLVVPNRSGSWARQDNTPFGQGHPFSMEQIQKLLSSAHFQIDSVHQALFFPPYEPKTMFARLYRQGIEKAAGLFCMNSGVFVIEASKRIYSPTKGLKELTAENARKMLMGKPKIGASGRTQKIH